MTVRIRLLISPSSTAVWTARDTRPFLEVGDYFGPDRRFRSGSGPGGVERRADLIRKAELEAARAAEKAAAGDEA